MKLKTELAEMEGCHPNGISLIGLCGILVLTVSHHRLVFHWSMSLQILSLTVAEEAS